MAKRTFFVTDYIKPEDVSKSDTAAPAFELIDIDLIDSNDANFYELSELEALANSIAMDGLQQPLVVMTSAEDPQRVILLSGHRRRAAIKMLIEDADEPRPDLRMIPCIRRQYSSPAMAELQLILANSTARVLTSPEVMRQAERTEMLLYQLKEEGYDFPGKMRDHVAAACNASASKLARLKVIRERLEPEFLEAFENRQLSEDAAYHIAKDMSSEIQRIVIEARTTGKSPCGLDVPAGVVDNIANSLESLEKNLPAECPSGDVCNAKPGMQRRIARFKNSWDSGCSKCCLDCWSRDRCATACSVCKEKNKEATKKRIAQQKRDEKAREKEVQKLKAKNKAFAERMVNIAPDAEKRKKLADISWQFNESALDSALSGENANWNLSRPDPTSAIKLADEFNVSLDYIYGRSADPNGSGSGSISWTSVDDDLPPLREWVLGNCPRVDPSIVTTKLVERKGDKVWLCGQIITHWAPLPAAPEVKV